MAKRKRNHTKFPPLIDPATGTRVWRENMQITWAERPLNSDSLIATAHPSFQEGGVLTTRFSQNATDGTEHITHTFVPGENPPAAKLNLPLFTVAYHGYFRPPSNVDKGPYEKQQLTDDQISFKFDGPAENTWEIALERPSQLSLGYTGTPFDHPGYTQLQPHMLAPNPIQDFLGDHVAIDPQTQQTPSGILYVTRYMAEDTLKADWLATERVATPQSEIIDKNQAMQTWLQEKRANIRSPFTPILTQMSDLMTENLQLIDQAIEQHNRQGYEPKLRH